MGNIQRKNCFILFTTRSLEKQTWHMKNYTREETIWKMLRKRILYVLYMRKTCSIMKYKKMNGKRKFYRKYNFFKKLNASNSFVHSVNEYIEDTERGAKETSCLLTLTTMIVNISIEIVLHFFKWFTANAYPPEKFHYCVLCTQNNCSRMWINMFSTYKTYINKILRTISFEGHITFIVRNISVLFPSRIQSESA